MVDLRPNQLPPASEVKTTDKLVIDQGTAGVNSVSPNVLFEVFAPVASQEDAEVGADNTKRMTPLRTKQSISSEIGVTLASASQGTKADSAVQTVNGKSGTAVVLVKADVGLGNVDNTSDANKPISTATQNALDGKATTAQGEKADSALQALGGTTGQVLVKNSDVNNDVIWVSSEAATAVSYGPQTLTAAQQVQARQNIQADKSYDSVAIVASSNVPSFANATRINGYHNAGDGGGALYKKVSSEPAHAGKVQSADGAWWEISETTIAPEMFGAKPSPFDSRDAFDKAFSLLGIVASKLEAHGDYAFSGPVTATIRDGVEVDFKGAHFRPLFATQQNLFDISGLIGATFTRTLTSDAVIGDLRVTVSDLSGIEEGQGVKFYSREFFDAPNNTKRTYETNRVRGVEAPYVYLDAPLLADFTSANDIGGGGDGTITLTFATMAKNLKWRGGTYHCQHTVSRAVSAMYLNDPIFSDMVYDKVGYYGLFLQECCGPIVQNCHSYDHGRNIRLNGEYNSGGGQAFGYGFIVAHACFAKFTECIGGRGWHTFDAADGTRDVTYINCSTLSDMFGFSTHESCNSATYINCSSEGKHAHTHRGRSIAVQGGVLNSTSNHSFGYTQTVHTLILEGVRFKGHPPVTIYQASQGHVKPFIAIITGCIFDSSCGISCASNNPNSSILFEGNEVVASPVNGGALVLGARETIVKNNIFKDFVASVMSIGGTDGYTRQVFISDNSWVGTHLGTGETSFMLLADTGVVELHLDRNAFDVRANRIVRYGNPQAIIKRFVGNVVGANGPNRLVQFYLSNPSGLIEVQANNTFIYPAWVDVTSGMTITHRRNDFVVNQV